MVVEQISKLKIEEAFKELEDRLLNEGCKITNKKFPNSLDVEHGSLVNWSYSPKMILKKVHFYLTQQQEGTKLVGVTDFPTAKEGIAMSVVLFALLFLGIGSKVLADVFTALGSSTMATIYNALAIVCFVAIPFSIVFQIIFYIKKDQFVKELLRTL